MIPAWARALDSGGPYLGPKCLDFPGPAFATNERYLIRPTLVNHRKCLNSLAGYISIQICSSFAP
jgi:hypothetical protein